MAYRKRWITSEEIIELVKQLIKTGYGRYLIDIIEEAELKKFKN